MKLIFHNLYFFSGLGGKPRLLDIGGVPYLVPLAQKTKLYEMKDIPKMTDFAKYDDCLIIGAGAAPWTHLKRNAEVVIAQGTRKFKNPCQKTRQINLTDFPFSESF